MRATSAALHVSHACSLFSPLHRLRRVLAGGGGGGGGGVCVCVCVCERERETERERERECWW